MKLIDGFRRLYAHLTPRRRKQLAGVLALMLVGALAELVTLGAVLPFLAVIADPGRAASYPALQALFGSLGWREPDDLLVPVTALFATVALVAAAVRLCLTWVSQRYVFRLGHDLGVEVYRRTLYQPYSYHVAKNTSELIAATNKVQIVVGGMLMPLMQAASGAIISAFILAALIMIDASTAFAAAAGFGAMYFAVSYVTRVKLRENSRIIAEAQAIRIQTVQEGLGGIRDVIIDQAQPTYVNKFADVDLKFRDAQALIAFFGAAPRYVIEAVGMVVIAFLALALSRQQGGLVTALPVLGALALGAQRLLPLLQLIYAGWTQIAGARHILFDVLDLLDLPIEERSASSLEAVPFSDSITFDSVHFRYAREQGDVLRDINLRIRKGARVGFIGTTGSGKSTLMDIAMGLLEPSHGRVLVDGQALTSATLRNWRSRIAHVPQSIYLADASIAENIAFGAANRSEIDIHRVAAAAEKAKLAEFIGSLPAGYWTPVGERGVRLSGGQRQRIGIARALYKEADVLVFDEATSALDTDTEAAVMAAIQSLGREQTILVIAHRLSTVAFCDSVARLENGHIEAEGRASIVAGA